MNISITFAKLAGLYKIVKPTLDGARLMYRTGATGIRPQSNSTIEYFERYESLRDDLIYHLPDLYSDLKIREIPIPGSNGIPGEKLETLVKDMEYIFEVRSNSEKGVSDEQERPSRVFISHGRSQDWREVQAYVEKDIKLDTLELAQEANKGRTVLQKLDEESQNCSFAVVVMTGDDQADSAAPRVRENVMHEIGFFQGKFGLANVCLLHEEGVSIPSNIHGVVYIPFPKDLVIATFGLLTRELRAAFPS